MDNKGQANIFNLPVTLLVIFIVVSFLVALLPAFVQMLDLAQNSQSLNCNGFVNNGNPSDPLSFNSTIGEKSTIGCLAIKLYIPYIVLGLLVGLVAMIFYPKQAGGGQETYY